MSPTGGPPDLAPPALDPASPTYSAILTELRAIRTELHEGRTLNRQLIGVLMDLRDELAWARRSTERVDRAVQLVEDLDARIKTRDSQPPPMTPPDPAVSRTKTGG